MATRTLKIGLSATDKQNMAQDVYDRLLDTVFEDYSSSSTYNVGDYVVYNNVLYRCVTAIVTPEAWDSSKWEVATLQDLVDDVNDAVRSVNNKANVDGYYLELTAGSAEQLVATKFVQDEVPYNYRTSGGDADIGNRVSERKIVGGTLGLNQLIENGNFESTSGWFKSDNTTSFTISNNIGTLSGITSQYTALYRDVNAIKSHKYFVSAKIKAPSPQVQLFADERKEGSVIVLHRMNSSGTNTLLPVSAIVTATTDGSVFRVGFTDNRASDWTDVSITDVFLIDLTAMFGSIIADYIYSLEQATAGAGVAWFKNYFPKDYYDYNAGTLLSTKASKKTTIGFNQWDERWINAYIDSGNGNIVADNRFVCSENFIKVLPNTTYYCKVPASNTAMYFTEYDENGNFIKQTSRVNTTIVTQSNTAQVKFFIASEYGTTYNHDICINLSWSGWRNGEYEPYEKHEYDLPDVVLRGIPKLDSDNNLYFDGDYSLPSGETHRRYGVVDLGTLNWNYSQLDGIYQFSANVLTPSKWSAIPNIIVSNGYIPVSYSTLYLGAGDKQIACLGGNSIRIKDSSYTNATAFKQAMQGVYLVYELVEPTTETTDTYQELQIVNDFGTEEFTCIGYNESTELATTISIPCGHDSDYYNNLRDKLQRLPEMPAVSQNITATYVVNYNGTTKKCSFVGIEDWLTENGYKMQDLSSQITAGSALAIDRATAYKIGNVVNLCIYGHNASGSSIPAGNVLFTIGASILPVNTLVLPVGHYISANDAYESVIVNINKVNGVAKNTAAIPNGDYLYINVSYAVA